MCGAAKTAPFFSAACLTNPAKNGMMDKYSEKCPLGKEDPHEQNHS